MSETPFKRWYDKNKKTINSKRKDKYHSDPAARADAVQKQREYRAKNPTPSRAGEGRMKLCGGKLVESFRISEVAESIGRSVQTIRLWERNGLIPAPTVESSYRFYTGIQVVLLRELADVIALNRHEPSAIYDAALEEKRKEIFARWAL